jgi:transcriptional regulator NrdR family protein
MAAAKIDLRECPACSQRGIVLETRRQVAGVRRRYGCTACPQRWNTLEQPAVSSDAQGALLVTERERVRSGLLEAADALQCAIGVLQNVRGEASPEAARHG